uniref:Uncharacterized protein n=1 Tax=Lepeophtheirus salmonis TaxID=72036 RepID=A0A0K2T486_LEPSM
MYVYWSKFYALLYVESDPTQFFTFHRIITCIEQLLICGSVRKSIFSYIIIGNYTLARHCVR